MDIVRGFASEYAVIVVPFAIIGVLAILIYGFIWYRMRKVFGSILGGSRKEGFQAGDPQPGKGFTNENCANVKMALENYENIYSETPDKGNDTGVALKKAVEMFKNMYNRLRCEEYLARVDRGEIAPPKTNPSNKPTELDIPSHLRESTESGPKPAPDRAASNPS